VHASIYPRIFQLPKNTRSIYRVYLSFRFFSFSACTLQSSVVLLLSTQACFNNLLSCCFQRMRASIICCLVAFNACALQSSVVVLLSTHACMLQSSVVLLLSTHARLIQPLSRYFRYEYVYVVIHCRYLLILIIKFVSYWRCSFDCHSCFLSTQKPSGTGSVGSVRSTSWRYEASTCRLILIIQIICIARVHLTTLITLVMLILLSWH
jgi:hypothetical protein